MLTLLLAASLFNTIEVPPAASDYQAAAVAKKLRESGDSCDLDNPTVVTCWMGSLKVCTWREVWTFDGWGPPSCEMTCFVYFDHPC